MKLAGFAERLAFARVLMHFRRGRCVTNTEIGAAVERTQPWVTKWAKSATPPKDYEVHRPLAAYLGVEESWLIRGEGDPPDVDLWDRWIAMRAKRPPQKVPAGKVQPAASREAGKGREAK